MSSIAAAEKDAGNACHSQKRYDEAIKHWSNAIEALSDGSDKELLKQLYSNRSATNLLLKLNNKALEDAEKAIQTDRNWAKGFTRKGNFVKLSSKY